MKECDNKSQAHLPVTIGEDQNALRVLCTICHHQYILRKDPFKQVPENRAYSKIFKRDIMQGNTNLLYKYNPQFMRT